MSPVESCGTPSVSTIFGACEPFPAPGGPKRIMMSLPDFGCGAPRIAARTQRHTFPGAWFASTTVTHSDGS